MQFFRSRPGTDFLGKFSLKYQNCQFKLKFGTQTNSNMQNSKVIITFSVLPLKYPFWANLVKKNKIVSLSWNLVARLIWMQNLMVVFTFPVFLDRKHTFRVNSVQKIEIVSLSWNLVPRLTWICRIQCWCSLFLCYTGNTRFYCLCDRTGVETLK